MKRIVHNILSTGLALLVLLSTVSWTVDKHLCMGRVMDVSLFVEADDCGMEAAAGLLEAGRDNHCCGDETFTLQGQEDLLHDYQDISLGQQQFFVAFAAAFLPYFFTEPTTLDVNWHYPPPQLVHDVQVWHQVFLI